MKKSSDRIKFVTTTKARSIMSEIIDEVKYLDKVYAIGRRDKIEALVIKYPENFNPSLDEINRLKKRFSRKIEQIGNA